MDELIAQLVIERFDLDTALFEHRELITAVTEQIELDPIWDQIDRIADDLRLN